MAYINGEKVLFSPKILIADGSGGMTEQDLSEYLKNNSITVHELISNILITAPAINVPYENWNSILRINQSGNATSLQADLDTKSDKMRLLNTYTFEEERVDVTFTQTDDGVAYKDIPLKKYIIHTYVPKSDKATTTVYNAIYLKFTQENPYYTTGKGLGTASITNTDAQYAVVEADVDKKTLFHSGGGAKSGYDGAMRYHTVLSGLSQDIGYALKRLTNPIIDGIKWQSGDANTPFPIGTIIEIWGCA